MPVVVRVCACVCTRMCACVYVCADLLWGEVRAQTQSQGRRDQHKQRQHQWWLCPAWLFHQDQSHQLYGRQGQAEVSRHFSEWEGFPLGLLLCLT